MENYQTRTDKERMKDKKLQGRYFDDVKEVTGCLFWQWMRSGNLRKNCEGFVLVA